MSGRLEVDPAPPSPDNPLHIARQWTQAQIPLFTQLLNEVTVDVIENKEHIFFDDTFGTSVVQGVYHENPFTRPICHGIIGRFPLEQLAPGMEKKINRILCFSTDHIDVGHRHSDITLADVHIDPTFGQFFPREFSSILRRHSDLFVGNVLVAREWDIRKAFNASYENYAS